MTLTANCQPDVARAINKWVSLITDTLPGHDIECAERKLKL
jgi:hypothetical protein